MMRSVLRIGLVGIVCLAVALGMVTWITGTDGWEKVFQTVRSKGEVTKGEVRADAVLEQEANNIVETFPDPNAPGTSKQVFLAKYEFDSGVFQTAMEFMKPASDERSLVEIQQQILERSGRGLSSWRPRADRLALDSPPTPEQATLAIRSWRAIAFLEMYDGRLAEAKSWLERALELSRTPGVAPLDRAYVRALLGIAALRRGEIENCLECLGPSSCIFPIDRAAVHRIQGGSREAIAHFTAYLEEWPGDLRIRWLLNLAYMTLGEYPEKVPPGYLVPLDRFRSKVDVGRFDNAAPRAGLGVRGPGLAGGSIFDDFNGDGLPDLFTTSVAVDQGPRSFSTAATVHSRTVPGRLASTPRSTLSTSPGPITTMTATSTSCSCAAGGRSRPGSRFCGTKGMAFSRM